MSRIDLHVDELFDGARRGTLSTTEAARLDAHCKVCLACRAELDWVGDGLHLGAASDADRALGARAVEALLGGMLQPEPTASQPVERPRAAAFSRWQAAALVCLGLLMASASAALYTEVQAWRAREAAATRGREPVSSAAHTTRQRRARMDANRDPAPVEPPPLAPAAALSVSSAASPAPALAAQAVPVPASPAPERARRAPVTDLHATPAPPEPSRARRADVLFARANAERSAGQLARALTSYEALEQQFPETRSALASRLSRAELLLRRMHAPVEALAAYRSYLAGAPHGPLAEEARAGVATCAQQLGQHEEERKAWQELLERHPGSLHAERAHARLRALSP